MQTNNQRLVSLSIILLTTLIPKVITECCHENMEWMREYTFGPHGDVTIKWNFTDDEITMVMVGRTQGWIALGFASNKSLNGADIVFGWLDKSSKKVVLQDRFGSGGDKILTDSVNNYEPIHGRQNSTSTIICWKRKLDTCDHQDVEIKFMNTYRVFWAIGEITPSKCDMCEIEVLNGLGSNTGVESLHLLSLKWPKPNSPDIKTIDVIANNITISPNNKGYMYWCTHLKLAKANTKSHLIAIEPIIQNGNADLVHHFQFLKCHYSVLESLASILEENGYNCFDYTTLLFEYPCNMVLLNIAQEGNTIVLPDDVGYPFHSTSEDTFFLIQMHYNVEFLKYSRQDSSGLRFYYTTSLRKDDAATLIIGNTISPFTIIPPEQKNFTNVGICSSVCTKSTISNRNLNIFGILLHGHLTARKITFTVIRDGEEVESVSDDGFTWDYQDIFFFQKPLVIEQGDEVVLQCVYDTSTRNTTTIGYFGTYDEMCLAFVFYSPPTKLTWCASYLHPKEVFDLTGINAIHPLPTLCIGPDCPSVYATMGVPNVLGSIMFPLKYHGMPLVDYLRDYKWTDKKIASLEKLYYSDQTAFCKDEIFMFNSSDKSIARYPSYTSKSKICQINSGHRFMISYSWIAVIFVTYFSTFLF